MNTKSNPIKLEYKIISNWVQPKSSVLDLGCGDGELLVLLMKEKQVKAQGIEIAEPAIYTCVRRGLNVLHGDIDSGLTDYSDRSFDYVILNQTFQEVKKPDLVLQEALRVGKYAIVGFPNFAHYRARVQLGLTGKVPVTHSLPNPWYTTPNLHFLSILDFIEYCREKNINIIQKKFIAKDKSVRFFPNLFAELGVFLLAK